MHALRGRFRRPARVAALGGAVLLLGGTVAAAAVLPAQGAVLDTARLATGGLAAVTLPATYLSQTLSWKECYPGKGYPQLLCAVMHTPRDWNRPTAGSIGVVLSRVKAGQAAKRRGVLFTNPGGPGEPGLMLPLYLSLTEPELATAYDLVGMDPRGAGSSTALHCADPSYLSRLAAIDGRSTARSTQATILALDRAYAATCTANAYTHLVSTFQTVRDVNLARALLHVDKLSYLGYSAGTWLGAWFATTFPARVDRMLLDGNLDFTSGLYSSFARQPGGFQFSLEHSFEPWAAQYDATFHLGTTGAAVKRSYEARRAAVSRSPIHLTDGSWLTPASLDGGIASSLYWSGSYPQLGSALAAVAHWASATADERRLVTDTFGTAADAGIGDAFWAVSCGDTRNASVATVQADTARFRVSAPLIGATWNVDPCMDWPTRPTGAPMTGKGMPPVLLVNNAADPATPLANANIARRRTANARLVVVSGEADHTIVGAGDPCVEKIARAWLLGGPLPSKDRVCAGLPLPRLTPAPAPAGSSSADPGSLAGRLAGAASVAEDRARRPDGTAAPAGVWITHLAAQLGPPAVSTTET